MKHFIATYTSKDNQEEGCIYIEANGIIGAQDKFFEYIKETGLYGHMWQLSVEFKEIQGAIN